MKKITTVGELITMLEKFDQNLPVTISDGHEYIFYEGVYEVEHWVDGDFVSCDIGIGGTRIEEDCP